MEFIYWTAQTAKNNPSENQNGRFYFWQNNYRHRIKSTDYSNLIFVEHHFRSNSYVFNGIAKFTIIKRIEKNVKIKWVIEK